MYKKIIAVIAVLSLTLCLFSQTNVCAASEFIIKKDGSGNSFLSGYNGNGGTVTIPKGVSYIGSGAFENDVSIKNVTIPESCESIDDKAFSGCVNLKTVIFEGNVSIGDSAFLNCVSLEKVFFKNHSSKAKIGESSFANCLALNSINLPENTSLISKFAFGNCVSLETITLPKNAIISDRSVGYMYDEKNDRYFLADGETEAYISYYELYNGKAVEWYAPKTGKSVTINVVKGSDGARYAKSCKIPYAEYISSAAPKVTAEPDVDSIVLKWNKINGTEAYRVYISDGGNYREYKTTSAAMCTVSGLESGKSYKFKVASMVFFNGKKYSEVACSEEVSAVTDEEKTYNKKTVDQSAPKVTAEPDADNIVLKWNKISGIEAYRVYISDGGDYKEYKTTASTMCTVSGLENGKSYKFKVVSMVSIGKNKYSEVACSEEISAVTNEEKTYSKKTVIPSAPKVTAKAGSDSVVLEWKRVNGADAYRVYIFDSSKNEYVQYKVVTGRSCTVAGLKGGAEYKFKVVSLYSPTGRRNKYVEGEASGEIVVSTSKIVISD